MKKSLEAEIERARELVKESKGFIIIVDNKNGKAKILGGGTESCWKEHFEVVERDVNDAKKKYDNVTVIFG